MKKKLFQIIVGSIIAIILPMKASASDLTFTATDPLYVDTCIDIPISLNATQNVTGGTTVASFPVSLMQIKGGDNGISAGNIFNTLLTKAADNSGGTAKYVAYRLSNYSGQGIVNNILFNIIDTGVANLNFVTGTGNTELAINGGAIPVNLINTSLSIINDTISPTSTGSSNTWYIAPQSALAVNYSDAEAGFHQITVNNPAGFPKVRQHITQSASFSLTGYGLDHDSPWNNANTTNTINNTQGNGLTHGLSNAQCGSDPERYYLNASVSGAYCFQPLEYYNGTLTQVQDTHGNKAGAYNVEGRIQDWPVKAPVITFGSSGDPDVIPVHIDFPSHTLDLNCDGDPEAISYKDITDYQGNQTHQIRKEDIIVKTQRVVPTAGPQITAKETEPGAGENHAVVEFASNCNDPLTACDITIKLAGSGGSYLESGSHNIIVSSTDDYWTRQQSLRSAQEVIDGQTITPQWTKANSTRTSSQSSFSEAICEPNILATPLSSVLTPGETVNLNVVLNNNNGSVPEDITFDSDTFYATADASIATVDGSGVVTAVSSGTAEALGSTKILVSFGAHQTDANIIVAADGTLDDNTLRVYPSDPAVILLDPLSTDNNLKLTAIYNGVDVSAQAQWQTSSSSVAEVTNGLVKALAPGNITVSASHEDQTVNVNVSIITEAPEETFRGAAPSFNITPASFQMITGGTIQLKAFKEGGEVTNQTEWNSNNESIATVDTNGVVTAHAQGVVNITANYGGETESASGAVSEGGTCGYNTYPSRISMWFGDEVQLLANHNGQDVTKEAQWVSEDTSIASVDQNGNLRGVSTGSTTIRSQHKGNINFTEVTVTESQVSGFTIYPANIAIRTGQVMQLSNTFNGTTTGAQWSITEGESFASIDNHGMLTAKVPGTVTITATSNGQSVSTKAFILPATSELYCSNNLSSIPPNVDLEPLESVSVTVQSFNDDVTEDTECISTNELVAQVTENCTLTGINRGSAELIINYNGTVQRIPVNVDGTEVLRGAACDLENAYRAPSDTIWVDNHGNPQTSPMPERQFIQEMGGDYPISSWWYDIDGIPHASINGQFNEEGQWYAINEGWYNQQGVWQEGTPINKNLEEGWFDDFNLWHEGTAPRKGGAWTDKAGVTHFVEKIWKQDGCITHVTSSYYDGLGDIHGASKIGAATYRFTPYLWIPFLIIFLLIALYMMKKKAPLEEDQTDENQYEESLEEDMPKKKRKK